MSDKPRSFDKFFLCKKFRLSSESNTEFSDNESPSVSEIFRKTSVGAQTSNRRSLILGGNPFGISQRSFQGGPFEFMEIEYKKLGANYKVLEKIGSGSLGAVYRVQCLQTNLNYAVKIVELKSRVC